MNNKITLPSNKWKPFCSKSFANWYKKRVKSPNTITEDFNLLNYEN